MRLVFRMSQNQKAEPYYYLILPAWSMYLKILCSVYVHGWPQKDTSRYGNVNKCQKLKIKQNPNCEA